MVQSRLIPSLLLASSLSGLAQAQTYTNCNPLAGACPNNPGLQAKTLTLDFTKLKTLPAEWTTENYGSLNYDGAGAKLSVAKPKDSLNIISNFYLLFGSLEFRAKVAPGRGIVTAGVLLSDALDEIDWEILGATPNEAQSNYFGKNDTGDYDRGKFHATPANSQASWLTYRLDWTPEVVQWSIDGNVVRTLRYSEAKGGTRFPQTPMRVKIGAWAAGDPANGDGVVHWAGGLVDWSAAPFVMALESIKVTNYSPAKEYIYGDRSGRYESIKLVDGSLMSNAADAPKAPEPPVVVPVPVPSSLSPPVSEVKPTATSTPLTVPIATQSTAALSTGGKGASSTQTASATTTLAKPAVATTNAAARGGLASGLLMAVLAMTPLMML